MKTRIHFIILLLALPLSGFSQYSQSMIDLLNLRDDAYSSYNYALGENNALFGGKSNSDYERIISAQRDLIAIDQKVVDLMKTESGQKIGALQKNVEEISIKNNQRISELESLLSQREAMISGLNVEVEEYKSKASHRGAAATTAWVVAALLGVGFSCAPHLLLQGGERP